MAKMPGQAALQDSSPAADDCPFVIRLTSLAMLISLAIGYRCYFTDGRIYGFAPVLGFLDTLPDTVNGTVFVLCILSLLWLTAFPYKRLPMFAVVFCQVFWVLQDIPRFQPFYYMYCFTFLVLALYQRSPKAALNAIRIMICGVYFWAGFHKINMTFYESVFPWFLKPIYSFNDPSVPLVIQIPVELAVLATPFVEAAIGILLLFSSTRKYACIMAFMMLTVVLMCLGPLGHNWAPIVWPWNVWLFWMEYRLLCTPTNRNLPFLLSGMPRIGVVSFLLFFIAPAAAMWTLWYDFPGFKLYSGNTLTAEMHFPPEEMFQKVPEPMKATLKKDRFITPLGWVILEKKSYHLPAIYTYKAAARGVCPYLDYPSKATLKLLYPAPFYTLKHGTETLPLCP